MLIPIQLWAAALLVFHISLLGVFYGFYHKIVGGKLRVLVQGIAESWDPNTTLTLFGLGLLGGFVLVAICGYIFDPLWIGFTLFQTGASGIVLLIVAIKNRARRKEEPKPTFK